MLHNTYMETVKKESSDGGSVYLPRLPFKRYISHFLVSLKLFAKINLEAMVPQQILPFVFNFNFYSDNLVLYQTVTGTSSSGRLSSLRCLMTTLAMMIGSCCRN